MAGEITLQQLFQQETIRHVVSRFKAPISLFQRFYGMAPGMPAVETFRGRNFGWDIFDFTRSIAKGRAPMSGPATVSPKPVGHVSAMAYRAHEKIMLEQERVFNMRAPGMPIGTVDVRGQNYVARQMNFLLQRFRNAREFMVSRMFRGGFGVKMDGEDFLPCEMDDAEAVFTVDFQIPADNKNGVQLGTGSDILNEPWDDPNSNIVGQILALDKAYERVTGRPMRHIWINGTTFGWLLENYSLHKIGGEAFRIFESLTRRTVESQDGLPETGYDVVFRALPLHVFHVYNGVLGAAGEEVPYSEAISAEGANLLVPDRKAIFTPDPSPEWCGWGEGSEPVAEHILDPGTERTGFHSWVTRVIDPPGWELKMVDNGLPITYIPRAICYGTIA